MPKARSIKEKVEKFDFIKINNISFVKEPRKRMKKTRYSLGENMWKPRLLYKTHKEPSKFNRKRTIQKCVTKEDTDVK